MGCWLAGSQATPPLCTQHSTLQTKTHSLQERPWVGSLWCRRASVQCRPGPGWAPAASDHLRLGPVQLVFLYCKIVDFSNLLTKQYLIYICEKNATVLVISAVNNVYIVCIKFSYIVMLLWARVLSAHSPSCSGGAGEMTLR